MDPNKSNTSEMDVRSPLREINLQNNQNPEQNNSPNKSVNLLDATTTSFDNSILMPATDSGNTLDVTTTNQENQRPRYSILGTFDPIYQKSDNGKSDSTDVDLRILIDDPKQPLSELINEPSLNKPFDENKLVVPENELNKSNVSNVSSVSDASEQNNTVILSKSFSENKEDPESVSVTPVKFVPQLKENIGGSDLSDSFLEKFTKATVISTPTSLKKSTDNVLEGTFVKEEEAEKIPEELDTLDADSIDLENPISQTEDFDTDSLNEDIESAQNQILHELSVESSKIVCELNKTQEILKDSGTDETLVAGQSIVEKEKLQQPVTLEQKEQIIQEINVTYSEPISPNKLERQEEIETVLPNKSVNLGSPKKDTSLEIFVKEEIHQQQLAAEEISQESDIKKSVPISPSKVPLPEDVPTEIVDKNTSVKSIDQNISFEVNKTASEVNTEGINKNSSFVIEAAPPFPKLQLGSQELSEIVKAEDTAVNKNLSFVIETTPETPQKLSESLTKEEIANIIFSPVVKQEDTTANKNISFVIETTPESPQKLHETDIISSPIVKAVDSAVDKNISFVIETKPETPPKLIEEKLETPKKLSEIIQTKEEISAIISSPVVKPIDSAVDKNTSFVIDAKPVTPIKLAEEKPETPLKIVDSAQKLSEIIQTKEGISDIISSPAVKPVDSAVDKNISFVIESTTESQKLIGDIPGRGIESAVNKNTSFVIETKSITPQKLFEEKPETPKKAIEEVKSEDLGVKPLDQASDEIVKTPQKIVDTAVKPIVEPVIVSEPSEIIHMSEAKPIEKSEVSESAVTNTPPTNEMGEVINQKECFQKQSDITNGAVDNKATLDPKNEMYNEMVERLSLLESECEKYKIQVADLKREIKTCRQKSASLESEVADLKRKENELNILLDEYKNKKPESTDTDGKDEELKLLRASEETLKNEVIELKVLVKQHENKLKELQQKEVKLADDLSSKTQSELQISRVMEEYEKSISSLVAENEKMKKERDTAQMHLSNIELAFSDVHQKYERCKRVVQGYKDNEESYRQDIAMNRETIATQEQKYATLKAHAMAQLEKSNQELLGMKKQHETEMARLTAQLKRYEIKNDSLMEALQQKTKECEQLSAVCDEFIGNV